MPEDTKAGMIQAYLDKYTGSMVCSKQLTVHIVIVQLPQIIGEPLVPDCQQKEVYKIPYETHPADRPRQCVFGGTSNALDFLPLDRSGIKSRWCSLRYRCMAGLKASLNLPLR